MSARRPDATDPAEGIGHVLAIWEDTVDTEISPWSRSHLAAQASNLGLGSHSSDELRRAARHVHNLRGALRLADWELELRHPGYTAIATIPDRWETQPALEAQSIREALSDLVIASTNHRIALVLSHRFALDGNPAETLQAVGNRLGISRERVRQLELKALRLVCRRASTHPLCAALATALSAVVDGMGTDRPNALLTLASLVMPQTPPRLAVTLLASAIGCSRTERKQLLDAVHGAIQAATVRQDREFRAQQQDADRSERLSQQFDDLLASAWWPNTFELATEPWSKPRAREINPEFVVAPFQSIKMNRDIGCESEPERQIYRLCDTSPAVMWFAEQPCAIPYVFDGRHHTYYPDAILGLHDGRVLLVEVKPLYLSSLSVNRAKWQAAERWCYDHGFGFLVTDGRRGLAYVDQHSPPAGLAETLAEILQSRPVSWPELLELRSHQSFTALDLAALVRQHDWEIRLRPWRLSLV